MFAAINGTKLFYETRGLGPAMLLMHGGLGLDHSSFPETFDALADQVQLIYYDHRGNGQSERVAFDGVTHATFAADAEALRAHLGHEQIILVGHSYGGFLAQEYAARYQDKLAGLILCNTAPAIDYMDVIQANAGARGKPAELEALGALFGRPMADDDDFKNTWAAISPMYFHNYDAEVGAALNAKVSYSAAAWNHANGACLPGFNVLDELKNINTPTLVISGADDWITPLAQGGQRIHEHLPNSELVVFDNSGHWPFVEERAKFISVVRDWLSRLA